MNIFKFKEEESKKEIKEFVKSLDTNIIDDSIKRQKLFLKVAEEEYSKRKDRKITYKIGENIFDLIEGGIFIFILAIFYFGALPNFFGVNNEFINPINNPQIVFNESINISGINNTFYFLGYEGAKITTELMDTGAKHPIFWFWFFWIIVFYFFIIPIIKLIINIIKLIGGKTWDSKKQ